MSPPHQERLSIAAETLQRTRRVETKLTQMMIVMGIDTQSQKPLFVPGSASSGAKLVLPSPHCSLKEMIDNIPETWNGPVEVFIDDERVATLGRAGNRP